MENKRSKLAVTSFIISLIPILIPLVVFLQILISFTISPPNISVTQPVNIDGSPIVPVANNLEKTNDYQFEPQINKPTFSRVIGGFGFIFFSYSVITFWLSIFSLILAVIALVGIKHKQLRGKGFAIWSIVLSVIVIASALGYIYVANSYN
ncbi:MAG: DUF4190 domain-containing protein [Patescibacteria group bacterium]